MLRFNAVEILRKCRHEFIHKMNNYLYIKRRTNISIILCSIVMHKLTALKGLVKIMKNEYIINMKFLMIGGYFL